jgi:glycosyltransferase involved in cell wall biosynthesis
MSGSAAARSVLFVLSSLTVGGSERKSIRLANHLQQNGWRVSIAYLNQPHTLREQIHPSIAVTHLDRRGKFSPGALRGLRRLVKSGQPSFLVAVNLYAGLYAWLATWLAPGAPELWISVNTTEFRSAGERRQMLLYRWVLRAARGVIFGASSQQALWEARYGLRRPGLRNFVLYNGIDTRHFHPGSATAMTERPRTALLLGTVGKLRAEKAHVDLVRAVAALRGRGIDAGALFVGDGPERAAIESEAQRLGIPDRVVISGETADVRPYLAAMDLFVLTSVSVETFSNAALEAMAMGIPVVSSRIGGMAEMLDGTGWTYEPGDVAELDRLLEGLLRDPAALRAAGDHARETVERRFSLEGMAATFTRALTG